MVIKHLIFGNKINAASYSNAQSSTLRNMPTHTVSHHDVRILNSGCSFGATVPQCGFKRRVYSLIARWLQKNNSDNEPPCASINPVCKGTPIIAVPRESLEIGVQGGCDLYSFFSLPLTETVRLASKKFLSGYVVRVTWFGRIYPYIVTRDLDEPSGVKLTGCGDAVHERF